MDPQTVIESAGGGVYEAMIDLADRRQLMLLSQPQASRRRLKGHRRS
jgi:hypothetical protein